MVALLTTGRFILCLTITRNHNETHKTWGTHVNAFWKSDMTTVKINSVNAFKLA